MPDLPNPSIERPWLALYPPDIPSALAPATGGILALWQSAVAAHGAREAIRYFDASLSFAEADRLSDALAGWLVETGTAPGARVALCFQNTPHFVIALLAIWKAGAIPVPCNPMYRPTELGELLADARAVVVICEAGIADIVQAALDHAGLSAPIVTGDPRDWQSRDDERVLPPVPATPGPARLDLLALCRSGRIAPPPPPADPEAIGLILYTSGTTGKPKGAAIRHGSIAFNSEACARWMGIDGTSRVLALAPLFHITGFILHFGVAIFAGAPMALLYRFHPGTAIEAIRAFRPTVTIAAITAYNALLGSGLAQADDFASFESVYTGGAPVAPGLRARIHDQLGISLLPAYGMTETCSPTHLAPRGIEVPVDPATGALAVGIPISSTEIRICAADGRPLPIGEAGEVWLRGPQIMARYWEKPAETAATLVDGWLRSGDVGVMDAQGWLYIVDRQKDMISASGFKVWPRQVEDVLITHRAVREAAVVGEPDAYRGETVHAYVSLKPGEAPPSLDELVAHCRAHLAAYKVPRHITILTELPKTITGKIQRAALRGRQGAQDARS